MKILIATSRFKDLAGSEITVFEYAEEFNRKGNVVSIASFSKTSLFEKVCQKAGIIVSTLDDEVLINTSWDLIWVLHSPAYYALFTRYNYQTKRIVFSSLSHFEPLEAPPIEVQKISLFTTNSSENKSFFCEQFPDYAARVSVLPNSIPESFWEIEPTDVQENKLIIVSNHLPNEVIALADLLRNKNWQVDIYGIGYLHKKVAAEDLVNYRACISIGKTVQYAIGLKIPVFCYDRFGGPGWITLDNVELAAEYNFSGRCSNLKHSAEDLAHFFKNEAIPDIEMRQSLYNYAKKIFSLNKNLAVTLSLVNMSCEYTSPDNVTLKNILAKHLDIFLRDQERQDEFQTAWVTESQRRFQVEEHLLEVHKAWQVEKKQPRPGVAELQELKDENTLLKEKVTQQDKIINAQLSKLKKYFNYIRFARQTRASKKAYQVLKTARRIKALIYKAKK